MVTDADLEAGRKFLYDVVQQPEGSQDGDARLRHSRKRAFRFPGVAPAVGERRRARTPLPRQRAANSCQIVLPLISLQAIWVTVGVEGARQRLEFMFLISHFELPKLTNLHRRAGWPSQFHWTTFAPEFLLPPSIVTHRLLFRFTRSTFVIPPPLDQMFAPEVQLPMTTEAPTALLLDATVRQVPWVTLFQRL